MRPFDLAKRQVELDRAATALFPDLFLRKRDRMLASPHALLRGSAPLFYQILADRPDLWAGPSGEGWIVGDMHLENVGAYRNDKEEVVFDLNDFDDAAVAPWRLDVLRLSTSVLLASRGFRAPGVAPGPEALHVLGALLEGYAATACAKEAIAGPATPAAVTRLIEAVGKRSMKEMLDSRAPEHHGKRHLLRGDRYHDLSPEMLAAAPELLKEYIKGLGDRAPSHAKDWQVEDAAFRVAGTGSLGGVRMAVLVRTRSGDERLLDFKQAGPASLHALIPATGDNTKIPSDRVVAAATAMLPSVPRLLASIAHSPVGLSFLGRKLRPQEDKLDLSSLTSAAEIEAVARMVGHLLGAAHRREATVSPSVPWTAGEIGGMIDHAVELAGIFEGIYLAYSRITF